MQKPSLMVVMISNGPGELSTWVKPLAEKIHSQISLRPKNINAPISLRLALVPCPNATGKEQNAACKWNLFEKIISAKNFWNLLINPKKYGFWPSKGIVIFLGGDQFWSVLLAARLGYQNMTYAEWIVRWPYWNDRIFAMSTNIQRTLPKRIKNRCVVVGDLIADINQQSRANNPLPKGKWIALMPGSKKTKLIIGLPFFLEVADHLAKSLPNYKFLLPIAPTTDIKEFLNLAGIKNPIAKKYSSGISEILEPINHNDWKKLITIQGTEIYLFEDYPAHKYLSQCEIALTTVGANTAELAALTVPMIVVIPTQHLNVMEAWDGFIGILARMPFLKKFLGIALSIWRLKQRKFMAWPNISAGRMVVPERIGNILPKEIAEETYEWLSASLRLEGQKKDLQKLRGESGAVEKMSNEIINSILKLKK